MRAADDLVHCATLKRFSLKNKRPPITKRILKDLQRLSPELLKKDPKFEDAEIAVQSNQERVLLGKLKAIAFAKKHGEPVFCWVLNMTTDKKGVIKKDQHITYMQEQMSLSSSL